VAAPETLPEAPVVEATPAPVVTIVPEPSFAARIGPPPAPRPRPEQRRGIFFDVENTSRAQDIEQVLRHLMIDRIGIDTDFTAVGNWRVIGHETARLLARTARPRAQRTVDWRATGRSGSPSRRASACEHAARRQDRRRV
jgi:hypothetical protein